MSQKFVIDQNSLEPMTKEESKRWRQLWWRKLFENVVSVKVWTIFLLLFISSVLCWQKHIDSDDWVKANTTVISIVFGLREGFKTAKIKNGNSDEKTWV